MKKKMRRRVAMAASKERALLRMAILPRVAKRVDPETFSAVRMTQGRKVEDLTSLVISKWAVMKTQIGAMDLNPRKCRGARDLNPRKVSTNM